jgi:ABC-2 type transport system permease protein
MSSGTLRRLTATGAPNKSRAGVQGVYRAERRKLTAQLSTRVLALICLLGPPAFAVILQIQSGVPADTLFGVWVHSSGYAVSLVVLGFAGSWGFPVMAGALAGDLFSGEDRHGTWKLVLTRSADRRDVYIGKLLAAATLAVALVALTAASSLTAGIMTAGAHSLVGLSGNELPSGHALGLVIAAWATSIPPTLGFVALAALFSLITRNGIAGALGPVLVALIIQLLDLIGSGSWVHAALLGSAFSDWHGLFVARKFFQPLLVDSLVSLIWIAAAMLLGWRALRHREFAGDVTGKVGWVRPAVIVIGSVAVLALLAAATSLGPTTITPRQLQRSLAPSFNDLTLLQQRLLGRAVPTGARLQIRPTCFHRGSTGSGPGDVWTCTLDVFIPQQGVEPFRRTAVTYDMSVQSNGCYKADSPPAFIGQQMMRDKQGNEVVNPLFTIYGCFKTDG